MSHQILKGLCVLLIGLIPFQLYAQEGNEAEKTLDERINEVVKPATDAIETVVFWSFKIKDDVMIAEEGVPVTQDRSFYKNPPFEITYDEDQEGVPYDLLFKVERQGEGIQITDAAGNTALTRSGEPVSLNGFDFVLNENSESAYSLSEGKGYTFRLKEVMFLPLVIIILLAGALFFTLYFGFVNIRRFGLSINIVRGAYSDPNESGEVSHFQALTAALSATVGLGNIAGVAIAISIGGPGATVWMILAGILGMSTKFVECTLGVKYRKIAPNGEVSGGPMYYLSEGLKKRGMTGFGKFLAAFFAVMCIGGSFGGGNMVQVNQAFSQFSNLSFVEGTWIASNGWAFGVVMAILVAIVIIGGIRSIARVTDKIVPLMVVVYMLAGFVIIFLNIDKVPETFGMIFGQAFAPKAIAGGFVGVLIQGFRRAAFSNEAGVGSASIAHSAVKTNNPASEGLVALLEPFIDTVVVCTMTALVIVITGEHLTPETEGVALTSRAFSQVIPWFKYVLAVAVLLFAFSTMISWSYYGLKSWTYLFGNTRVSDITYKLLFCVFVVIGAAASLKAVFDFSDAMIFAMVFPNVIGLVILAPEVRQELRNYIGKIKSGEIVKVK